MSMNSKWALMTVVALVIGYGCGGDDGVVAPPGNGGTPVTLGESWAAFENGNYSGARDKFQSLIGSKGEEAHEGVGWCNLKLNDLRGADTSFDQAPNRIDANAGAVFVNWALEEYGSVEQRVTFVLTRDTNWVFAHDLNVDVKDIYLHSAYSHLHLGNYSECLNRIKNLDANYQANLNDPNIGKILLDKLELLKETID